MKHSIKNLARLVIAVYLASVLAGGGWVYISGQRLGVIAEIQETAVQWNQGMLTLLMLSSEAVLFRSDRAVEQWHEQYSALRPVIDRYGRISPHSSQVEAIDDAFTRLPELADKIFHGSLSPGAKNQYVLNLQSRMQFMIMASSRLSSEANRKARWIHLSNQVALGLIFIAHLLVSALILVLFRRWVKRPIDALMDAVDRFGRGDLSTPITVNGSREVRKIAAAVDQARHRLSQLTVSRDELEQRVQERTAELQQANRDLEGFSYSVSHDLRAPLRAIDGFISILQDEHAQSLDEDGRRMFGIVSDNAQKMSQLIDDILSLSRAGRLELEVTRVDMNRLVDQVWGELAQQQAGRDIDFRRSELPELDCDPRAIRQVWQNLLGNALKFTRGREPALIEISGEADTERIHYRIRDNGAGFDPRYADKLFGLFQRLHGADEFEGTGVGLSIVKRLLGKHGGDISAEGAPDAGASFDFTLPRKSKPT